MSDEERAAWLAEALEGHSGPEGDRAPDNELDELLELGTALARMGPEMRLLSAAEESFDPAFSRQLKAALLAAHPAASGVADPSQAPEVAGSPQAAPVPAGRAARGARILRRLGRRIWLLLALAALALLTLIVALQQPTRLTALKGRVPARPSVVAMAQRLAPPRTPSATWSPAPSTHLQTGAAGVAPLPTQPTTPPSPAPPATRQQVSAAAVTPLPTQATAPPAAVPPSRAAATPGSRIFSAVVRPTPPATAMPQGTPPVAAGSVAMGPRSPLPATPTVIATVPGTAPSSTAPVRPAPAPLHTVAGGGAAPGLQPSIPGLTLDTTLPRVPAAAPDLAVQAAPLTAATVRFIAGSFPGARPAAGAAPATQAFIIDGQARLTIVAARGEVRYSLLSPAPASPGPAITPGIPARDPASAARSWLQVHGLYPNTPGVTASVTPQHDGTTLVRFLPPTVDGVPWVGAVAAAGAAGAPPPAVLDLSVELDATGRVIAAHRLWPTLVPGRPAPILAPVAALQAAAASGQLRPALRIQGLTLVYAPIQTAGRTVTLRPAYLVRGLRGTAGGPAATVTMLIAAR